MSPFLPPDKCHWREKQWSGSRVTDCWKQFSGAASRLLLYSSKSDLGLWCSCHPPTVFISLVLTHFPIHPHPLRNMAPGSQTHFSCNLSLYHTNESTILLLHYSNHPPSQPHSRLCHHCELFELLKFKIYHQPPLCSHPSFNLMHTQEPVPLFTPCL